MYIVAMSNQTATLILY